MPAITRSTLVLCLLLCACGGSDPPPQQRKPQPTVFDDLVDKKTTVPGAVEATQQRHMDATRRAIDGDGDSPSGEPAR